MCSGGVCREQGDSQRPKPTVHGSLKEGRREIPCEVRNEMLNKVRDNKCRWDAASTTALMGVIITDLMLDLHSATHTWSKLCGRLPGWVRQLLPMTTVAVDNTDALQRGRHSIGWLSQGMFLCACEKLKRLRNSSVYYFNNITLDNCFPGCKSPWLTTNPCFLSRLKLAFASMTIQCLKGQKSFVELPVNNINVTWHHGTVCDSALWVPFTGNITVAL